MIAVDTDVIIRLLTRDDEQQYQTAYALFKEQQQIFIPKTVILEAEWVLRYAYDFDAGSVVEALSRLLGLANVESEDAEGVATALEWHAQGLDFADALHLSTSRQADSFATFDQRFTTRAESVAPTTVLQL